MFTLASLTAAVFAALREDFPRTIAFSGVGTLCVAILTAVTTLVLPARDSR
ncbi:hypothetical protein AB0B50_38495 [Streptomyces sp. NPDC041068]|uniref:hypothetical protein n=1 Tax=Streptomyces sp. NPDC041068 TaxID=3155130 RepID=UPI0033F0CDEB